MAVSLCGGAGGSDGAGEAGKAGNQACHGNHSTRNAAAAAHPSHRPGPSCGPLRGLGFPSLEPVQGPVVPGASEAVVALGAHVSPSVWAGGAGGLQ